jgi:hypothetical protein
LVDRIIGNRVRHSVTTEEITVVLAEGIAQFWTMGKVLVTNWHDGYIGVGAGTTV